MSAIGKFIPKSGAECRFKLGDARHQLVNQLVGLLEGQRQAGWWRNGFAHDVMVPSWRDQARGNSGSRDDRLTFSCQCHLGEQLHWINSCNRPEM